MTNQEPEETQSGGMEDIEITMDGPGTFPRSSPRHLETGSSTSTSRGSVRSHKNYRSGDCLTNRRNSISADIVTKVAATSSDRPELPLKTSDGEFVTRNTSLQGL